MVFALGACFQMSLLRSSYHSQVFAQSDLLSRNALLIVLSSRVLSMVQCIPLGIGLNLLVHSRGFSEALQRLPYLHSGEAFFRISRCLSAALGVILSLVAIWAAFIEFMADIEDSFDGSYLLTRIVDASLYWAYQLHKLTFLFLVATVWKLSMNEVDAIRMKLRREAAPNWSQLAREFAAVHNYFDALWTRSHFGIAILTVLIGQTFLLIRDIIFLSLPTLFDCVSSLGEKFLGQKADMDVGCSARALAPPMVPTHAAGMYDLVYMLAILSMIASIKSRCSSKRKSTESVLTLAHEFAGRVEGDQRCDYELFLKYVSAESVGAEVFPFGLITNRKVLFFCRLLSVMLPVIMGFVALKHNNNWLAGAE